MSPRNPKSPKKANEPLTSNQPFDSAQDKQPETRNLIRIRLGYPNATASISSPSGDHLLSIQNGICTSDRSPSDSSGVVRIDAANGISTVTSWSKLTNRFRGVIECRVIDGALILINELPLETYLAGLAEEDDSQPYEKQKAFAIAARTYAAHYLDPKNRKFPGKPYDGSDSPAEFQAYGGVVFEAKNPRWVDAVKATVGLVLTKNGTILKTPYFSSDDGRTRSPEERGWTAATLPFPEVFQSKLDPWCEGLPLAGHGVGMSGCGAKGQAHEGKIAEQILQYYYSGTELKKLDTLR